MFVKKLKGSIRLCIDYKKLNVITKKDKYLILLIEETIARIIGYKIIIKLNIRKVFNRIRITTLEDKELLTFYILIRNFKLKVLQFRLINRLVSF